MEDSDGLGMELVAPALSNCAQIGKVFDDKLKILEENVDVKIATVVEQTAQGILALLGHQVSLHNGSLMNIRSLWMTLSRSARSWKEQCGEMLLIDVTGCAFGYLSWSKGWNIPLINSRKLKPWSNRSPSAWTMRFCQNSRKLSTPFKRASTTGLTISSRVLMMS